MSVLSIEQYRQRNGEDILKVILKPTRNFPNDYFYADAVDENLVKKYTWHLNNQFYVVTYIYGNYKLYFHQEKAYNVLSYYPDYINHVNGIEFDNIDKNLDVVTNQQNLWSRPTRGYQKTVKSFQSYIKVNYQKIWSSCVRSEAEACIAAYNLELTYKDYRYDFLRDRRNDLDILDLERTGKISEEEAIYLHVCRYDLDNAWYVYRYNLFEYFKEYHINVPSYALDGEGFMVHPVTGKRLCPF